MCAKVLDVVEKVTVDITNEATTNKQKTRMNDSLKTDNESVFYGINKTTLSVLKVFVYITDVTKVSVM